MNRLMPNLRSHAPGAWTFHCASSRWPFNMLSPDADESPEPGKEDLALVYREFAEPAPLGTDLETAIRARVSCREFLNEALDDHALAALLHHGLGVTGTTSFGRAEIARRPCPSPGGLYPLELYVIARSVTGLSPGIYHYHGQTHSLGSVRDDLPPPGVHAYLFMDQPYAAKGAANIVITCMFGRSVKKYRDRGYRYALLEAGHVAQNITLSCAALGLGCCPLGGFFDHELSELLKLDLEEEAPLYALTIGVPDQGSDSASSNRPSSASQIQAGTEEESRDEVLGKVEAQTGSTTS